MSDNLPTVTHVGNRVSRKAIQRALIHQFGNFIHTQPTLDYLRDIGPAQVGNLGWVIAGNKGGRWAYFLAEVRNS